jgi:hypothetical protein
MVIETKFNIGDEIWFLSEGKAIVSFVVTITYYHYKDNSSSILYRPNEHAYDINEKYCFASKQELIDSL